jgi:hypothetical protein
MSNSENTSDKLATPVVQYIEYKKSGHSMIKIEAKKSMSRRWHRLQSYRQVALIPVVHFDFQISPRIFEKN